MPNRAAHIGIGFSSTLAWEAYRIDIDGQDDQAMYRIGAGTFAALAPDLIERALSPRHRKFFHSVLIGGALLYLLSQWCGNGPQKSVHRWLSTMAVGYLSHLCADCRTPAGLPWCGFSLVK